MAFLMFWGSTKATIATSQAFWVFGTSLPHCFLICFETCSEAFSRWVSHLLFSRPIWLLHQVLSDLLLEGFSMTFQGSIKNMMNMMNWWPWFSFQDLSDFPFLSYFVLYSLHVYMDHNPAGLVLINFFLLNLWGQLRQGRIRLIAGAAIPSIAWQTPRKWKNTRKTWKKYGKKNKSKTIAMARNGSLHAK